MWLELAITSKVSKFESYAGWPLSGVGCSPFQPIQVLPQELLDCFSYPDSLYLTFLCLFVTCKDNPRLNQFFYDLGIKHRNFSFLFKTCFYPDCERVDILKFFKVDIGFSHPCRTKIWNLIFHQLLSAVTAEQWNENDHVILTLKCWCSFVRFSFWMRTGKKAQIHHQHRLGVTRLSKCLVGLWKWGGGGHNQAEHYLWGQKQSKGGQEGLGRACAALAEPR